MKYAHILHRAWKITVENPAIKWFVFIPAFMAVLIFCGKIAWQVYLYLLEFGLVEKGVLAVVSDTFRYFMAQGLFLLALAGMFVVVLFMYVIPAWVTAVQLLCVDHRLQKSERELIIPKQMLSGFKFFFSLFGFNGIMVLFSPWSIILFSLTLNRYFTTELMAFFWPIILTFTIAALIINVFVSFAPYYIVCDDCGPGQAMGKSASLVFLNFYKTLSVVFLMGLVNLRIVLNALIILGVPMGLIMALVYGLDTWAISLIAILGILLLALISYVTALVEVFMTGVWLQTFYNLKERQAELDHE